MNNRELLKRAAASLDVLKGYVKTLDESTLDESHIAALNALVDLAASVPLASALKAPRSLTEG
jgi:hypothetical protein